MYRPSLIAVSAMVALAPTAAMADTPRELLTAAAFQAASKPRALAMINQAIIASDRILASRPADREAVLQRGVAIGYRAKLTRSRSDARSSLSIFEHLAAQNPHDPEVQMAVAGWHLDAIDQLGGFMARTALGAKIQAGKAALARSVALGGDRAFYPGLAAMMLIRNDPDSVAQARQWAEAASTAKTPTPLDVRMKRAATAILPALRASDGRTAAMLTQSLLPFGKLAD
ncbi:hypothetical protein ABVV53_10390 [Novosphingobium sp. RD2P27]|uniref:Sel1 repeat family protein n=2 Tax=Novosphingobium kalidii TaxID=3230299 RepID=A0ABV2D200_9SPHN